MAATSSFVKWTVFLVIFTSTFALSSSKPTKCAGETCKGVEAIPDWDYLLFVVQWPESFCLYYNASRSTNSDQKCIIPRGVRDWTVHGTWPTKIGTEGPTNCNNTWTFDFSKVKDLESQLQKVWPDLLSGSTYDSFWAHEWDKHGTCASSLPALYGEHNYFGSTLKMHSHFNIDSILSAAEIVPSKTSNYTRDAIFNAIKAGAGGMPDLTCYQKNLHDGSGIQQYLAEVRLCIDKTFKPMDCPKPSSKHVARTAYYEPCSSKVPIMLPPITT
ncbi:ribonuclease Oy-like [Asterias rubens]|uniref:ribonuclease Oy-like n=1 Tax=Asterias rubens TaxID=7604 RepID=UPI0014553D88|nr:ribonuclease Oy-like [Asterias rubens]